MSIKFKIAVASKELNLDLTLQSGQCFRWFKTESKRWRGVIEDEIWTLHQDKNYLFCDVLQGQKKTQNLSNELPDLESKIRKYFRLDSCLSDLYDLWSSRDPFFNTISKEFLGIRILDQRPTENVFSFICSSNNNIERITKLVNHLSEKFGTCIATVDNRSLFSFPSIQSLSAEGTEEKLRGLAFGYRAKYIYMSATMIEKNGGEAWLENLKTLPYNNCHSEILKLPGVGPKVADCICLMSMNHLEAIPVDTHVFQIATRNYLPHLLERKSVTTKVYKEIADHFRELFGSYAGWAHSVLFTADLKKFKGSQLNVVKGKGKKRSRCKETP